MKLTIMSKNKQLTSWLHRNRVGDIPECRFVYWACYGYQCAYRGNDDFDKFGSTCSHNFSLFLFLYNLKRGEISTENSSKTPVVYPSHFCAHVCTHSHMLQYISLLPLFYFNMAQMKFIVFFLKPSDFPVSLKITVISPACKVFHVSRKKYLILIFVPLLSGQLPNLVISGKCIFLSIWMATPLDETPTTCWVCYWNGHDLPLSCVHPWSCVQILP